MFIQLESQVLLTQLGYLEVYPVQRGHTDPNTNAKRGNMYQTSLKRDVQ